MEYLGLAIFLLVAFIYLFYSKLKNRYTVGLHRRNVRRKYLEPVDYDTMGIPVLSDPDTQPNTFYLIDPKTRKPSHIYHFNDPWD